jgi:hypothetical protein
MRQGAVGDSQQVQSVKSGDNSDNSDNDSDSIHTSCVVTWLLLSVQIALANGIWHEGLREGAAGVAVVTRLGAEEGRATFNGRERGKCTFG